MDSEAADYVTAEEFAKIWRNIQIACKQVDQAEAEELIDALNRWCKANEREDL